MKLQRRNHWKVQLRVYILKFILTSAPGLILQDSGMLIRIFFSRLSRATRFKGFRQQDSQELLRYLLDSIRSEEIKVKYFSFVDPK